MTGYVLPAVLQKTRIRRRRASQQRQKLLRVLPIRLHLLRQKLRKLHQYKAVNL
ncbi:hypothetical protein OESDEN_01467 [Oesophagostomum dentatum]|uniref:Uncharacterized protein n=1 Tax=Oesophagostomum dentatum TaxID=61180 RepID=A0A0B1TMS3_OESDE|nr:hypothetical protein OESDEN_01467 [Oesophagostomum dentatum]